MCFTTIKQVLSKTKHRCLKVFPALLQKTPACKHSLFSTLANMEAMYFLLTQKRWELQQLLRYTVGSLEKTWDGASSVVRTNGKESSWEAHSALSRLVAVFPGSVSCYAVCPTRLCSQVPVGMKWVIMHHVLGKNALRSGKTFHNSLAPTSERTKLRMKKTVVQGTQMATKLQIILSGLLWILGTRPRSSERTAALLTTEHLSRPPSLSFKIRLD